MYLNTGGEGVQLRVVPCDEVNEVGEVRRCPPFELVLGEGEGGLEVDLADEKGRVSSGGDPGEDVYLALCDDAWNAESVGLFRYGG